MRPGQPRVHSQVKVGSGEEEPAVFGPTDRRTHAHSHNCRVPNLLDAVHVPPLAFLTPSHQSNLCGSGQPPTCPGLWPLLHVLLAPRAVETSSPSHCFSSGGLSVHSVSFLFSACLHSQPRQPSVPVCLLDVHPQS